MMRARLFVLSVAGTLLGAVPQVQAETAASPHCSVLGQMTLSTWLDLMGALSDPTPEHIDPVVARLDQLSSSYANTGCDQDRLGAAMDCVLAEAGTDGSRNVARSCLQKNNLATLTK